MNRSSMTRIILASTAATAAIALIGGTAYAATPAPQLGKVGTLVPVAANSDHVAVTPNGEYAYVASATANVVTVVDLTTGKVVTVIPVGHGPVDVALDASGQNAYVSNAEDGTVSVIDTATQKVTATLTIAPSSAGIDAIAVSSSSAGDTLYVAGEDSNVVYKYDRATGARATIHGPEAPSSLTLADGRLVVSSAETDQVDVVNPATDRVVNRLTTPSQSAVAGAAAMPGGQSVALTGYGYTTWLDVATRTFTAPVPVSNPGNLTGVAPSTDGKYTFIATADFPDSAHPANGTITVVDNATHAVVRTVEVGQFPWSIAAGSQYVAVPDAPSAGPTHLQVIPVDELV
jgi:YVTN family beta-propeller protein